MTKLGNMLAKNRLNQISIEIKASRAMISGRNETDTIYIKNKAILDRLLAEEVRLRSELVNSEGNNESALAKRLREGGNEGNRVS